MSLQLAPGDPRPEPAVSALPEAQQSALVKRDLAIVAERRSGLRGFIVGADGRVSTSKVQAVLWTGALRPTTKGNDSNPFMVQVAIPAP
jgi:hypothetical protein